MDPITAGLVVGAVSTAVQAYQSAKAHGESQKVLDGLKARFEALVPPNYDLDIEDPPSLHRERIAMPEFINAVKPEVAQFVAEDPSRLIERTPDQMAARDVQKSALSRYMNIAGGDFDPEYQAQVAGARRATQNEAQSRQASILQDFARRGQGGSGISLAAQLGGAAQSMDRLGGMNMDAAAQAYRNRLSALASGADLAGRISAEDFQTQARNTDIINNFNQRSAVRRQANLDQAADTLNSTNRFNAGLTNDNGRWKYGAQVDEQGRNIADQQWMYNARRDVQSDRNNLETLRSNYDLNRANGMSGLASQQMNQIMGRARDTNAAIQGATNTVGTYFSGKAAQQGAQQAQTAADQRQQSAWTREDQAATAQRAFQQEQAAQQRAWEEQQLEKDRELQRALAASGGKK